jgi:hypothetical protein
MPKWKIDYEVTFTGSVVVEAQTADDAQQIYDARMMDADHKFDVPQPGDDCQPDNADPVQVADDTEAEL